jgi:hypothetical protein
MNEDRIAGTARNIGGKVEEGVGRATGDIKSRSRVSSTRRRGLPRISTGKPPKWRGTPLPPLKNGYGDH